MIHYTALRLGKYFNTSAEFRLNMQMSYDLKIETRDKRTEIDRIVALKRKADKAA